VAVPSVERSLRAVSRGLKIPGKPHISKQHGWWWIQRAGVQAEGFRDFDSIGRYIEAVNRRG